MEFYLAETQKYKKLWSAALSKVKSHVKYVTTDTLEELTRFEQYSLQPTIREWEEGDSHRRIQLAHCYPWNVSVKEKLFKEGEEARLCVLPAQDLLKKVKKSISEINECINLLDVFWEMWETKEPSLSWDPIMMATEYPAMNALLEYMQNHPEESPSWRDDIPGRFIATFKLNLSEEMPQQPHRSLPRPYEEKLNSRLRLQPSLKEPELDASAVLSLLRCKGNTRWAQDLKTHLNHSRSCKASDTRDRVYAFVGLADPGYGIVPDYTTGNAVVHAMIDTARKIIQHENSLAILHHTGQGREHLGYFLPSWVPDWPSQYEDPGLERYASTLRTIDGEKREYDAAKGHPTSASFKEDPNDSSNLDLIVQGVFVCMLEELEDPIPDFPDLRMFSTSEMGNVIAPATALLDDEVWVLYGATQPVLLRPEGERYSFLHEVLISTQYGLSELMFGLVIDLVDQGSEKTNPICIM